MSQLFRTNRFLGYSSLWKIPCKLLVLYYAASLLISHMGGTYALDALSHSAAPSREYLISIF